MTTAYAYEGDINSKVGPYDSCECHKGSWKTECVTGTTIHVGTDGAYYEETSKPCLNSYCESQIWGDSGFEQNMSCGVLGLFVCNGFCD